MHINELKQVLSEPECLSFVETRYRILWQHRVTRTTTVTCWKPFGRKAFGFAMLNSKFFLLRRILPCNGATVELRHWGDTQLWIDMFRVVCLCLSVGGERVTQWRGVTLYVGGFFPWSPSPSSNGDGCISCHWGTCMSNIQHGSGTEYI